MKFKIENLKLFYGGYGVMAALESVELPERVQIPLTTLTINQKLNLKNQRSPDPLGYRAVFLDKYVKYYITEISLKRI